MASDYRRHVGRSVLVQLEEHTLSGTLVGETQETLTLLNASLLPAAGDPTDMDGAVVVSRAYILWMQVA